MGQGSIRRPGLIYNHIINEFKMCMLSGKISGLHRSQRCIQYLTERLGSYFDSG